MAFTTPKTDFIASEGFAYTDINATNENIRVLAGGDNTLPLSTDAATAYALAKRDSDGDIAFRDVAARDIAVSRDVVWPIDIEHDRGDSIADTVFTAATRRIYIKRATTIRCVFTLNVHASGSVYQGRVYKNGEGAGIVRDANGTYSEDFPAVAGDYFEVWAKSSSGWYTIVTNFLVSSGSTVLI